MRIHQCADERAGNVREIPELSGTGLADAMAAEREPEIYLAGHGDYSAAQLEPAQSVVTGIACERVAHALDPQPGIGIVGGEITGGNGRAVSRVAILEKRANHCGRGN